MFISIDTLRDLSIHIADNNNLRAEGAIELAKAIAVYEGL